MSQMEFPTLLTWVQTDIKVAHPDVVFYDFYGAWDNPIPEDKDLYLSEQMAQPRLFLAEANKCQTRERAF